MAKATTRDRYKYVKTPYIAASLLAHVIWDKNDIARTEEQWLEFYLDKIHGSVADEEFSEALSDLLRIKFVTAYVDEFSPTYYKFFPSQFAAWPTYPSTSDNIMAKYGNLGKNWLNLVFANIDQDDRFLPSDEEASSVISIPASDRVVGINHNAPEWAEIDAGLASIAERIEQDNELSNELPDTHSRLLAGVKAARTLWGAASLHVMQVKIGILMVCEEIESTIIEKYYAAAVSAVTLLVRKFFKEHANVDLDGIV